MALAWIFLIAYLIGALPTAILAGRILRGIDIREHGSKNPGATNAWRVLGWRAGVAVLAIDLGKGVVAAALVPRLPLGPLPLAAADLAVLCGVTAVIGHVFPIYIGFHGGKGVATGAGMLLATAPLPVGMAVFVFLVVVLLTGYVSLGSLLGSLTVPLGIALLERYGVRDYPTLLFGLTLALPAFLLFTHRRNVARLLHGEETHFLGLPIWRRMRRR